MENPKPEIHAVIFDLDGTLLDTETLSTEAILMSVKPHGITEFGWELKKRCLGLPDKAWSKLVIEDLKLEGKMSAEELVQQWEKNLMALLASVQKMPGAGDLTQKLQEKGVTMAIATSSTRDQVAVKRVHHEDMFGRMKIIVCGDDKEIGQGKPAPDIYLLAASRLGVDPAHCMVFEDGVPGVRAGIAAGMQVYAVPDPRSDMSLFTEHTPLLLSSMEALDLDLWTFKPDC